MVNSLEWVYKSFIIITTNSFISITYWQSVYFILFSFLPTFFFFRPMVLYHGRCSNLEEGQQPSGAQPQPAGSQGWSGLHPPHFPSPSVFLQGAIFCFLSFTLLACDNMPHCQWYIYIHSFTGTHKIVMKNKVWARLIQSNPRLVVLLFEKIKQGTGVEVGLL